MTRRKKHVALISAVFPAAFLLVLVKTGGIRIPQGDLLIRSFHEEPAVAEASLPFSGSSEEPFRVSEAGNNSDPSGYPRVSASRAGTEEPHKSGGQDDEHTEGTAHHDEHSGGHEGHDHAKETGAGAEQEDHAGHSHDRSDPDHPGEEAHEEGGPHAGYSHSEEEHDHGSHKAEEQQDRSHDHSNDEEGHESHGHGSGEAHGEEGEHEPGVIHLTEQALENFGIETRIIESGDLTLTLTLYGWVRPRPQDVKIIRAPFPAILTRIFFWPGDFVKEGDLLLTFIVPDQLDWTETILSSVNEIQRLGRQEGLLRAEGHAKAVELIGDLQVAAAELHKLEAELKRLEQVGTGGVSKREIEVKRGEVNAARARLRAKRSIARTYGLSLDRIKEYEQGAEIEPEPDGAMPPEIRSQLEVIKFSRRRAQILASVAEAKLQILGTDSEQIERLRERDLDALKNTFTVESEVEGLITEVMATPPTPVDPEEEIMRLIDYRKVYVETEVPEIEIEKVLRRSGDEIPVHVLGLEEHELNGHVAYFDTEVRPDERMAHLFIEVENLEGMVLRDGMAATVGIPLSIRKNVLAVPKSSVLTDGYEKIVFVQEGDDFRRVPVRIGVTTLDKIEIVEGLEPGDSVVTSGVLPLLLALQQQEGRGQAGGHGHAH